MKGWDAARVKNTFVQIPQPSQKQRTQLKGRKSFADSMHIKFSKKIEINNRSLREDVIFNMKICF